VDVFKTFIVLRGQSLSFLAESESEFFDASLLVVIFILLRLVSYQIPCDQGGSRNMLWIFGSGK